jgi:hypothetical protein
MRSRACSLVVLYAIVKFISHLPLPQLSRMPMEYAEIVERSPFNVANAGI